MPLREQDKSDWEGMKKQVADDAPVPSDANDPDDGPYDPNDDEAVRRFLDNSNCVQPPAPVKKRVSTIR